MHASNYCLRLVGNDSDQLALGLQLAIDKKVRGWVVEDDKWLILYWQESQIGTVLCSNFPSAYNADEAFPMVHKWLSERSPQEPSDDIDGSVMNEGFELLAGYEVTTKVTDGHHNPYEQCRIRKCWAYYHK